MQPSESETYVTDLPHPVHMREHVLIEMPDGIRLSARIWLPEGSESAPVPAILEYIPYRKRDVSARRDARIHPYLAGHGYACVRVDIRGSGDSEGVLTDEYLESELSDGETVIAWIAAQPWCNGKVGMMGISWGGFNALQIAARKPQALKAVITLCSTDDRYSDDVHYMGGCLLADNQSWAAAMLSINSLPPDPLLVGSAWRSMWRERLEGSGFWLQEWLAHQRRDEYWSHGSICEDYAAIQVPVFAVSGWADGYSNSVFRLLARLSVPRKGLVGPWSHRYPHLGIPGPAIGFLDEALRWWDRWLKGVENRVESEPMLRVWMQDDVAPTMNYQERPGRWVAEDTWPSSRLEERRYTLGRGGLVDEGRLVKRRNLTIQSPLSVGLFAGRWCSFSATPDMPYDQREEDGGALVFQSTDLTEPLEILGSVRLRLAISSNQPVAMVVARLSNVSPDDSATRITYGLLNLTHRDGHADPKPLEPDRTYEVELVMNEIAQLVPAGHRLRLSLSTSYWPIAWPPPHPTRLTIATAASSLHIPLRRPHPNDARLTQFGPPLMTPPPSERVLSARRYDWVVTRDLARDISTLEVIKDEGVVCLEDIDLQMSTKTTERYSYRVNDFSSLEGTTHSERTLERGDWSVSTTVRTRLGCTPGHFDIHAELDAREREKRIFSRDYDSILERDHV